MVLRTSVLLVAATTLAVAVPNPFPTQDPDPSLIVNRSNGPLWLIK